MNSQILETRPIGVLVCCGKRFSLLPLLPTLFKRAIRAAEHTMHTASTRIIQPGFPAEAFGNSLPDGFSSPSFRVIPVEVSAVTSPIGIPDPSLTFAQVRGKPEK